jgi:hypothetical protein
MGANISPKLLPYAHTAALWADNAADVGTRFPQPISAAK